MHGKLAPHFRKAAQAARAVLSTFDYDAFATRLMARSVTLAFDANAATTREGKATLGLCTDLLARLYPNIDLVALDAAEDHVLQGVRSELESAMRKINPELDIASAPRQGSYATVVVGRTPVEGATLFVGSAGWRCTVSTTDPVGSGDSDLPFAAGVAACMGVASIFRTVFRDQLTCTASDDVSLDVATWEVSDEAATPSSPVASASIGETFLVGLGAIGHGFVWATALAPALHGTLHLIDDEAYDETNGQRYVGMPTDANGPKVTACAARLRETQNKLVVRECPATWDEFVSARGDWTLDRVLLALDSADDRRFVQTSLPRWIINSWTQRDNVGVSRHPHFTATACVCCLYQPDGEVPDLDDIVRAALNFPDDKASLDLVRQHLDRRLPLDAPMLDRITVQHGLTAGTFATFEGKTLEELYHGAICGGMMLQLGGALGAQGRTVEVPLAFQSALAGIMLAVELFVDVTGLRAKPLPSRTEINLLKPIRGTLSSPDSKHKSGRCICQDADYRAAYLAKYV